MGDYEADAPRASGSDQPNRGPDSERLYQAPLHAHGIMAAQTMFDVPKAHILNCMDETRAVLLAYQAAHPDAQIRALAPPDARASGASDQESKDSQ